MKGGITDRVLTAYRIGDPNGVHPIYDSEGARLYPGRWNSPACPIIYTSEHYSTAMLEKLVHANNVLPPNQHYIRIPTASVMRFSSRPPTPAGTARMKACARHSVWRGSRIGAARSCSSHPLPLGSSATF
jgi:RES domain-containing protein